MTVHAGTVVPEQRLRHEGYGLAVFFGHVPDDVFIVHDIVSHLGHRGEPHVDLRLPRSPYFVMMNLNRHAYFLHLQDDFGAEILERIGGRHREISFFVPNLISKIGIFGPAGIPNSFD